MATAPSGSFASAVTSVHLQHMRLVLMDEEKPRRKRLPPPNFLLAHPLPLPLYAYFDGAGELPMLQNVTWVNLSTAQPWAESYVHEHMRHGSTVQNGYKDGRMKCVTGRYFAQHGLCKDVLTIFKVAALFDAGVVRRWSTHLLWLDTDTFFLRSPDARFWDFVTRFDLATIFRHGQVQTFEEPFSSSPETGIIYLQTFSPGTERVLRRVANAFFNQSEWERAKSVNDISLFDLAFREADPLWLRLGRFGVACRRTDKSGAGSTWMKLARALYNDNSQRLLDCPERNLPAAATSVSSFNLFEYIIHAKGNGPMGQGALGASPHNAPGWNGDARTKWEYRYLGLPNQSATSSLARQLAPNSSFTKLKQQSAKCSGAVGSHEDQKRSRERTIRSCEERCDILPGCKGIGWIKKQSVKGILCYLFAQCRQPLVPGTCISTHTSMCYAARQSLTSPADAISSSSPL